MPRQGRKPTWPPTIRTDNRRNIDYIRVTLADGRHRYDLGPCGSEEARAAYLRLLAELESGGRPIARASGLTIAELATRYDHWKLTRETDVRELHRHELASRALLTLYGSEPAENFSGAKLEAFVRHLARVHPDWSRQYVNKVANEIRKLFRWALGGRLVSQDVVASLKVVTGLRRRDHEAPEAPRVRPVEEWVVEATWPWVVPVVRDMVRLQQYTGMRPGEVCVLRPCDLVRPWKTVEGVGMWLYRLDEHKTDWKGFLKEIPIGPRGQALLAPYLDRPAEVYCFSPKESVTRRFAEMRARRKGTVQPAQVSRAKPRRSRPLRDRYTTDKYAQAIGYAVAKANRKRQNQGLPPLPEWSPNQLRHLVSTQVETDFGREDARCVLGHANATTTAIYSEWVERAAKVIARIG
jgi:integrase